MVLVGGGVSSYLSLTTGTGSVLYLMVDSSVTKIPPGLFAQWRLIAKLSSLGCWEVPLGGTAEALGAQRAGVTAAWRWSGAHGGELSVRRTP